MLSLRLPLIRLDRLRRSARLATLVLAVFLLRIGVLAACAPSDLAEVMQDGIAAEAGWHAEDAATASETDGKHAQGHCVHCSCHHAVTLPGSLVALPALAIALTGVSPLAPQSTAPPDLSLRPPIV